MPYRWPLSAWNLASRMGEWGGMENGDCNLTAVPVAPPSLKARSKTGQNVTGTLAGAGWVLHGLLGGGRLFFVRPVCFSFFNPKSVRNSKPHLPILKS